MVRSVVIGRSCSCQKAPSAKRCIKTTPQPNTTQQAGGQKAPSAKRCIKTWNTWDRVLYAVTSQKAPSAKRCIKTPRKAAGRRTQREVRKRRAPNGALRRDVENAFTTVVVGQKAPSAKRCIKTRRIHVGRFGRSLRQKAPSAKRCIKTRNSASLHIISGNRGQKAPSAKRCIKTASSR